MWKGRAQRIPRWGVRSSGGTNFIIPKSCLIKDTRFAYTLSRGDRHPDNLDGAVVNNTLGSYTHLHPVASAGMFRHFVDLCKKTRG